MSEEMSYKTLENKEFRMIVTEGSIWGGNTKFEIRPMGKWNTGKQGRKSGKSEAVLRQFEKRFGVTKDGFGPLTIPCTIQGTIGQRLNVCKHKFGRLHGTGEPGRYWMLCWKCGRAEFGTRAELEELGRSW